MNARSKLILVGILRDRNIILAKPARSGPEHVLERMKRRDAELGLIRTNPKGWLGRALTNSDSVLNSRSYSELEAAGFLVRYYEGHYQRQTTHLQLTPLGMTLARQLLTGIAEAKTPEPSESASDA